MSASATAQLRIQNALKHIQNAQAEMDRAMSELSTLRCVGPTWSKGSKLRDAIHSYWYRVRGLPEGRAPITTDSEPSP